MKASPRAMSSDAEEFSSRHPDLSESRGIGRAEFSREQHEDRAAIIALKPPDPAHPEKDQFFVLGDNSAQSSDGRLWVGEWWVERELLIGKALFIYWPHGWEIPYVPLPFNLRSLFPENAPRSIRLPCRVASSQRRPTRTDWWVFAADISRWSGFHA